VVRAGVPWAAPHTLEVVPGPFGDPPNASLALGGAMSKPYSAVVVPGVGLVVRDYHAGVLVFQ
jgi:hypothetical protein